MIVYDCQKKEIPKAVGIDFPLQRFLPAGIRLKEVKFSLVA